MNRAKAIKAKCRDCIYDPLVVGTAAQQIACCLSSDCPLHLVRPITTKAIPTKLLEAYRIAPTQLDARTRGLVQSEPIAPDAGQNGPLLSVEVVSEAVTT